MSLIQYVVYSSGCITHFDPDVIINIHFTILIDYSCPTLHPILRQIIEDTMDATFDYNLDDEIEILVNQLFDYACHYSNKY
ncbi:MAG: hypothetical protein Q8P20_09995 [bacterium]|nr:hypothetical protein [bacterium]